MNLPTLAKTHNLIQALYYEDIDILVPTTRAQVEHLAKAGVEGVSGATKTSLAVAEGIVHRFRCASRDAATARAWRWHWLRPKRPSSV